MGVTGLWTVVQPCARPIKLETLNKKRLAVDASIWIYQFLKAVRDKEGNALRNSHVIGFFRRICKLLFVGIKPVFVFDGGAPVLKRQTVSSRKARREGRREDAVRTAGKLLAVQMQRRAEEDERKNREERERPRREEEEELPENLVYVDELQMTAQERQQNRTFRKKDAYHLPNLDVDLADMGAPNDPRIMSHEELEEYARQFHTGEDINVYDFSKIDFESPFFTSLPASDRYNILNAARLRSRLRMGYSKEQLDIMFPNRMDFSRFQIDRVKERNELTQRLMNLNGMNGDVMQTINDGGRVAGEKGKEYVLVKNDGVEGGWALGVVSNKHEGERNRPIDVENLDRRDVEEPDEDDWEEDGFEDVPIEGLNRLPKKAKQTPISQLDSEDLEKKRHALYQSRMSATNPNATKDDGVEDEESLFVHAPNEDRVETENDATEDIDELFKDVQPPIDEEDEELKRAIAMSLEDPNDEVKDNDPMSFADAATAGPRIDRPLEFNKKNAKVGREFAHLANSRAHGSAPRSFMDDSDDEACKASPTGFRGFSGPRVHGFKRPGPQQPKADAQRPAQERTSGERLVHEAAQDTAGFGGPLPFESLSLGKSILGQKKNKPSQPEEGGFEKESEKKKPAQPLPPWFSGDIRKDAAKQKAIEEQQFKEKPSDKTGSISDRHILRRQETGEVVDLDAPKDKSPELIPIDDEEVETSEHEAVLLSEPDTAKNEDITMGGVADLLRLEPPVSTDNTSRLVNIGEGKRKPASPAGEDEDMSDHQIDWSESEPEVDVSKQIDRTSADAPQSQPLPNEDSKSDSEDFEDIITPPPQVESISDLPPEPIREPQVPHLPEERTSDGALLEAYGAMDEEEFSDPEDEELMRQMAVEAEEHARFAAELNSKSQMQSAEEYEKELRQLRNQQKKDRRDADEVTHIMVTECQQLLRLFGLPYITAPMEAEAQCAELVSLGLVDGIVTDDSDIFLFGGTKIYKNMFNQSKFVECYLATDLEKEYGLDRPKLIRFAHLLGSDYTEGLPSVGPVTALEILSEFETLEQFSEWWSTIQLGQPLSASDAANPFRRKFRKNATKLFLPATFPDTRVDLAYLNPEVDNDPQAFQWGVPDLDSLRQFLMTTIGWSQDRTDEVLVPVIRDINRRDNEGTQANITRFFEGGVGAGAKVTNGTGTGGSSGGAKQGFAPRRRVEAKSQRMETALGRLHDRAREKKKKHQNQNQNQGQDRGERSQLSGQEDEVTASEASPRPGEKSALSASGGTSRSKRSGRKEKENKKEHRDGLDDAGSGSSDSGNEYRDVPKKTRKVGRGRRQRAQR